MFKAALSSLTSIPKNTPVVFFIIPKWMIHLLLQDITNCCQVHRTAVPVRTRRNKPGGCIGSVGLQWGGSGFVGLQWLCRTAVGLKGCCGSGAAGIPRACCGNGATQGCCGSTGLQWGCRGFEGLQVLCGSVVVVGLQAHHGAAVAPQDCSGTAGIPQGSVMLPQRERNGSLFTCSK